MKKNCWEFKRCGRQPGGEHVHDLGICPSATEARLNRIHSGINAGRACWVVTGTLCQGEVQGIFAHKYKSCKACDFYMAVKQEEHPEFHLSVTLLERLKA